MRVFANSQGLSSTWSKAVKTLLSSSLMKNLSTIEVDDSLRDPDTIRVGESVLEFQAKRERYCDHELSSTLILVLYGLLQ